MTAPTRPRANPDAIPAALRALDQWICFATEDRHGKPNKIPYTPGTRTKARSNDPSTWRSFDQAQAWADAHDLSLGFCFTPDLGMTFLDLDDVRDAITETITDQNAKLLVDMIDSYTQVSQSGAGLHVFCHGQPPSSDVDWDKIGRRFEVYGLTGPRFCLMTGDVLPGHETIEERTAILASLLPPRRAATPPKASSNGSHPELTPDELTALVATLAPHRVEGQQHFLDLAVGGWLAKHGVPEAQTERIVAELSANERKALDAVRDTYRNHAAGKDVQGWRELEQLTDPETAVTLDRIMARWRESTKATLVTPGRHVRLLTAQTADASPDPERWPAPPPEVYYGWFGGYLELVSETTEAPDQFHLASALTIVGAYAGRNVYTRIASGKVYPNLYTVLVGNSSESKKDTAIKRAWDMAHDPEWERERTVPPFEERNSIASAESFLLGMKTQSNLVLRMSEFSEVLANARRKGTTTILTMLMKAWDNPPQLSNDSIASPAMVREPYLTILAGTQPDVLANDLIDTDITSGFANRIFFVPGSGKGPNPWPAEIDERALHEHWKLIHARLRSYGLNVYLPLNRTPEVVALWERFYLTPRGTTAMERTMSQRHQNMVLKIALLYAMSDGATAVEHVHLARAIALIDWEWSCVRVLMGEWANSRENKLFDRMIHVIKRDGPMKRRTLWPKVKDRRWHYNDWARMVDNMVRQGTLTTDEYGNVGIPADD